MTASPVTFDMKILENSRCFRPRRAVGIDRAGGTYHLINDTSYWYSAGGIVAPQILYLKKLWPALPYAIFAVLALANVVLSWIYLIETKGRRLPTEFDYVNSDTQDQWLCQSNWNLKACAINWWLDFVVSPKFHHITTVLCPIEGVDSSVRMFMKILKNSR